MSTATETNPHTQALTRLDEATGYFRRVADYDEILEARGKGSPCGCGRICADLDDLFGHRCPLDEAVPMAAWGAQAHAPDSVDAPERHEPTGRPARKDRGCKPNKFAGTCHLCGGDVPAGAGFLCGKPGAWKVEHNGGCPEAPAEAAPARKVTPRNPDGPASPKAIDLLRTLVAETLGADVDGLYAALINGRPVTAGLVSDLIDTVKAAHAATAQTGHEARTTPEPAADRPVNRYPGKCTRCGHEVAAEAGHRSGSKGAWTVEHKPGECPTTPAPPAEPAADLVPEGRYALPTVSSTTNDIAFYLVEHGEGKWEGRTFVRLLVGGQEPRNLGYRQAEALLARLVEYGPLEAQILYGHETEVCGRCGTTLTNKASRDAGIGPTCATKW